MSLSSLLDSGRDIRSCAYVKNGCKSRLASKRWIFNGLAKRLPCCIFLFIMPGIVPSAMLCNDHNLQLAQNTHFHNLFCSVLWHEEGPTLEHCNQFCFPSKISEASNYLWIHAQFFRIHEVIQMHQHCEICSECFNFVCVSSQWFDTNLYVPWIKVFFFSYFSTMQKKTNLP